LQSWPGPASGKPTGRQNMGGFLRMAGGGRASEAVMGSGVSMTQGGPLTAWICLAPPKHMTRNPVYRIGSTAEAISRAGTGVTHARVCRERRQRPFDGIFAGSSAFGPTPTSQDTPGRSVRWRWLTWPSRTLLHFTSSSSTGTRMNQSPGQSTNLQLLQARMHDILYL